MSTTDSSSSPSVTSRSGATAGGTTNERSTLRAVGMPTEHGGWSLTLEPAVLGLLVAWSWAGLALGVAAMFAFLARTPLKLVLVDRWRNRWLERTRVAARLAAVELVVLGLLIVMAVLRSNASFWWPLLAAAPLVAIELWFDMRSRSRRLLPELAGTVGIGSVAAAIALVGGAGGLVAFGLWVVVATRGAAAIPYARTQVFRTRGKPHDLWHSDLAQALAAAAVVVGWLAGAVPLAAAIAIVLVTVFNIGAVRLTPQPAKIIGLQQMFFGITVVVVTTLAVSV
ncbi:MAG: YwiC-like family protein [Ilumatobacteraceae bacterium]